MEFYKDLLVKNKKSKFRVVLGLFFLLVAVAWIAVKQMDNEPIKMFDWIYSGIFALNAVVHTIGGLGYPIEGLVGRAFIKIDKNSISFKLGRFEKEESVSWEDVQAIDYKVNQLLILNKDESQLILSLSKIEYSIVQEVKGKLTVLSNKKGIKVRV